MAAAKHAIDYRLYIDEAGDHTSCVDGSAGVRAKGTWYLRLVGAPGDENRNTAPSPPTDSPEGAAEAEDRQFSSGGLNPSHLQTPDPHPPSD